MAQAALAKNSVIGYPTADSIDVEILGSQKGQDVVLCKKLSGAVQWNMQVLIVFKTYIQLILSPQNYNIDCF